MKNINNQIQEANENTENSMLGNFDPRQDLNKTLIFGTTIIDEEIIIDRISNAINDLFNDRYWIEHKPATNCFTLRQENRR